MDLVESERVSCVIRHSNIFMSLFENAIGMPREGTRPATFHHVGPVPSPGGFPNRRYAVSGPVLQIQLSESHVRMNLLAGARIFLSGTIQQMAFFAQAV